MNCNNKHKSQIQAGAGEKNEGNLKKKITIVWNALTFKTAGSLLTDKKDLHMTALSCANHEAL